MERRGDNRGNSQAGEKSMNNFRISDERWVVKNTRL